MGLSLKPGKEFFCQNSLQNQIKYVITNKAVVRRIFIAYFGGQYLTSMNIRKCLLLVIGVRSVDHCLEVQTQEPSP
jgi:hypothetical protein